MNPRITISVANLQGSAEQAEQELASAVGGNVKEYGTTRGGVGDAINFIAELSGPAGVIADKLLELAKNAMAGSNISVSTPDGGVIVVNGIPRAQLVEILQMAIDASKDD
jgi:hypothetical protein